MKFEPVTIAHCATLQHYNGDSILLSFITESNKSTNCSLYANYKLLNFLQGIL